jgi:DNA invertase Pin-like site-specific DNA recombinase
MNEPTTARAIVYGRVSTADQKNSEAAQESMLAQYCEMFRYEIAHRLADPDTSGSVPMLQRKEGRELFNLIEAAEKSGSPIRHIVVAKQDRMGRDSLDQITTIRRIWSLGVTPHFVAEGGALPKTKDNEMLFGIKASVAQYDLETIRERINIVMTHKFSQGEQVGNTPFGWRPVPTGRTNKAGKPVCRLEEHPEEMPWLLKIIQWKAEGRRLQDIAADLNRATVRTKRHGIVMRVDGKQKVTIGRWTAPRLCRLLQSKQVMRLKEQLNKNNEAAEMP